jgi:hypothetical protein
MCKDKWQTNTEDQVGHSRGHGVGYSACTAEDVSEVVAENIAVVQQIIYIVIDRRINEEK